MKTTVLNIENDADLKKAVEVITAGIKKSKSVKVVIECIPEKITDRIKTLEDALKETGKTIPDFSSLPEELRSRYMNLFAIETITEALNEGWKADWNDSDQEKWIPWFQTSVSSGFVFHSTYYRYSYAYAGNGLRLCFKSDELATYAGKQFVELYKEFIL